jgi:Transposase DDE domain
VPPPVQGRLGRRPRLHLRGEPLLPAQSRRALHHREKLRSGSAEAEAALSRQGRYKDVVGNLKVKEVRIAEDERFVICFNPEAAERDAAVRARMIAQLTEAIDGTDTLSKDKRAELRGVISAKPGLNRYLRVTSGGLLRIDASRAKAEENLDGKYLLRTSDPTMSAEDIALGYKHLLQVERGWKDMKQVIDLRPVYHRKEERIRAHVILCWLALLLARVAENASGAERPAGRVGLFSMKTLTTVVSGAGEWLRWSRTWPSGAASRLWFRS